MTPLKPMLAKDVDWSKLTYPVAVQAKIDGIRVHVQGGVALTRTLKRVQNAEIQAALGRPEFEGLDGEVIVGSPTAKDCYRRTSSFVMASSKKHEPWTFYVFDRIDFPWPYADRRKSLIGLQTAHPWPVNVVLVAESIADNEGEVERMEALLVEQGYEGAILRTLKSPYKHGRSTPAGPLLKVKRFVDFEAVVLGVYEENHNANERFTNELGRGARSSAQAGKVGKGCLGGLIVSPVDDSVCDPSITFRVGTGFDAATRQSLWQEANDGGAMIGLDGRIAKVKSFPIGQKDKPRHPVFLGWRHEDDR